MLVGIIIAAIVVVVVGISCLVQRVRRDNSVILDPNDTMWIKDAQKESNPVEREHLFSLHQIDKRSRESMNEDTRKVWEREGKWMVGPEVFRVGDKMFTDRQYRFGEAVVVATLLTLGGNSYRFVPEKWIPEDLLAYLKEPKEVLTEEGESK